MVVNTRVPDAPAGRLERVDLRKVWSREAEGFTPWLAQPDHLELLGETLGLSLEIEAVEKPSVRSGPTLCAGRRTVPMS